MWTRGGRVASGALHVSWKKIEVNNIHKNNIITVPSL
jgi:hypothetical protein